METERFPDGTDFALVGLEVLDKVEICILRRHSV